MIEEGIKKENSKLIWGIVVRKESSALNYLANALPNMQSAKLSCSNDTTRESKR